MKAPAVIATILRSIAEQHALDFVERSDVIHFLLPNQRPAITLRFRAGASLPYLTLPNAESTPTPAYHVSIHFASVVRPVHLVPDYLPSRYLREITIDATSERDWRTTLTDEIEALLSGQQLALSATGDDLDAILADCRVLLDHGRFHIAAANLDAQISLCLHLWQTDHDERYRLHSSLLSCAYAQLLQQWGNHRAALYWVRDSLCAPLTEQRLPAATVDMARMVISRIQTATLAVPRLEEACLLVKEPARKAKFLWRLALADLRQHRYSAASERLKRYEDMMDIAGHQAYAKGNLDFVTAHFALASGDRDLALTGARQARLFLQNTWRSNAYPSLHGLVAGVALEIYVNYYFAPDASQRFFWNALYERLVGFSRAFGFGARPDGVQDTACFIKELSPEFAPFAARTTGPNADDVQAICYELDMASGHEPLEDCG